MSRLEEIKKRKQHYFYSMFSEHDSTTQDDIEYLLNEVERLKEALTKINKSYDFDGNAAYEMQQIAEKALKEPTPE